MVIYHEGGIFIKYLISIDVGGTFIKYGLLDNTGEIYHQGKIETSKSKEKFIKQLVTIVNEYKEYVVISIGISMPGIIEDNGYLKTAGALKELYEFDLKGHLEKLIPLPIFIENDAKCAILGEKWLGKGKDLNDFILIVVGTGVGGAIVINGQLYTGLHNGAGEFGFMIVEDKKFCLGDTGSVQAGLIDRYRKLSDGDKSVNGKDIYDLAKKGDALAKESVTAFESSLSVGIFNLSVIFDPEIILIGGAISANKEFIKSINNKVIDIKNSNSHMGNIKLAPISASKFLNNSGIIGAAYVALKGLGLK